MYGQIALDGRRKKLLSRSTNVKSSRLKVDHIGPLNRSVPATAVLLAWMFSVFASACSVTVQRNAAPDIQALIRQLATPETEWGAASRLQKVAAPAAAALVTHLRQDGFRDRHHGNHSPTMRVLEKIGDPAIVEIERSLTPALIGSTNPEDTGYMESAILVLTSIGGSTAAPVLIRLAVRAHDWRLRELAFGGVAWPAFDFEQIRPGRPWEACLRSESRYACPFDSEAPRVAAVVRPLLGDVRDHMAQEPNARVRLAAAQLLTLWGVGALRSVGEQELLTLAARSDEAYIQESAIRALGLLGVDAARDVIKTQTIAGNRSVKRAAAQALALLKDDGYVPLTIDLMKPPPNPRNSSGPTLWDEDIGLRNWAFELAGQSHNVAFVPVLIELLPDRSWNGATTTTTVAGQQVEIRHTFGESARAALRLLTFQDFVSDQKLWREWWALNRNNDWRTQLTRYVDGLMSQVSAAEPRTMNEWMGTLETADDPAVLRFLAAYFRHPHVNISEVPRNTFSGGGGAPPVLVLLLNLASQGSGEARQLLDACSRRSDYPLAIDGPRIVAVFDRQKAIERLRARLKGSERYEAASALVQLGDPQGIPALIEELEAPDGSANALAFEDLRRYTQEDIPYDANASADARKAAANAWRQWWRSTGTNFTVKTRAARIDIDCCRF
jgi:HEAT repeat protein